MSPTKWNSFWQKVLKKNEEVQGSTEIAKDQKIREATLTPRKGNWCRRLDTCSPSKHKVLRSTPIKSLDRSSLCSAFGTPKKSTDSSEMPDLESIIREFERGYLSPSKQNVLLDVSKQNNFVKKIVAAFEVKYNDFNDRKSACDSLEESQKSATSVESWKRKSGIFGSPFKNITEDFKSLEKFEGSSISKDEKGNRRSGIFFNACDPPRQISFDEENDAEEKSANRRPGVFYTPTKKDNLDDSKSSRRSGILSSFNLSLSVDSGKSSSIYMSPVMLDGENSNDSRSDNEDCTVFNFDKEEADKTLDFDPLKMSSLDDTKCTDSIDLDVSLPEPEETIFLEGISLPKTSTMIDEFPTQNSVFQNSNSLRVDKTPKIVGAFLKKPIEVEDTSIDWIPITGKKLPRKKSLKKLLQSLTGKKFGLKKRKMFCSQEELQDSGYDEKSCSFSSTNSLISITDILMHEENSYVESDRRISSFKTFETQGRAKQEKKTSDASTTSRKQKLHLTEVPRDDVKLDLVPSNLLLSRIATMTLGRKPVAKKPCKSFPKYSRPDKLPKHPQLSSEIPKHPFVSLTKMDEPQNPVESSETSVVIKNDLYEVELFRSWDDIYSPSSCRSLRPAESIYDVPRRFLSKSDTELATSFRRQENEEAVYDVPRRQARRPRSSLYEDAVSLKRRSTDLGDLANARLYSDPRKLRQSCYATVKPRNCTSYVRGSLQELRSREKCMVY